MSREENVDKPMYMVKSRDQNAGLSLNKILIIVPSKKGGAVQIFRNSRDEWKFYSGRN